MRVVVMGGKMALYEGLGGGGGRVIRSAGGGWEEEGGGDLFNSRPEVRHGSSHPSAKRERER